MASYKGITFAKGYNQSFAEFKEEFGSTHVFKNIHPKERNREMKKAHKIAISDESSKDIEVKEPETIEENGDTSTATEKSEKDNSK